MTLFSDPDTLKRFSQDWTHTYQSQPQGVFVPSSVEEISEFLRQCSETRTKVIPVGGQTGLSGGTIAQQNEILISLQKLNTISPVDLISPSIRVGAGAITAQVNEKAAEHHLQWPIRFAAEGSSQIGGNLATNAGGIHVLRYGNTRSWVSSIEIVLMSGEILELNNDLEKNNTGFDLRHLLIGSEGTLAIITAATLKLTRSPQALTTCLFAINQLKDALHILNDLKASPTLTPHAFEVFSSNSIDLIEQASSIRFPLKKESPYYLIVEYESHASDSLWESWLNQNWCQDGTVAQSTRDQRQIWIFRENISETLSSIGPVHKNDLAVPISQLPSFVQAIESLYQSEYPDLDVYLYGHLGDGNLHINVQKPTNQDLDLFLRQCEQSDLKIFALLQKFRGSVSAEHGIGLKKKNFLHFSRSPEEINLMRGIKSVFDPLGLLNPGKCF